MHTPNEQDGRRQEDKAKKIRYRFAFDIGGTFTDLVLLGSDGSLKTAKVLSDQSNVVAPIANGVLQLCHDYDINLNAIDELVVGATTAVTNLVIERKGALTARVTSDVETMQQFFQWGAVAWLIDGTLMVLVAAVMLAYDWVLAVVCWGWW